MPLFAKKLSKTSGGTSVSGDFSTAKIPTFGGRNITKIIPVEEEKQSTERNSSVATPVDPVRAKNFQSLAHQITGIIDGAGVRVITKRAKKIYGEERAEIFAKTARWDEESREETDAALSRIAARYIKNDDAADLLAVGGGLLNYGSNFAMCFSEMRKDELAKQAREKQNQVQVDKTPQPTAGRTK